MVEQLLALPEDTKLMILAPVVAARKGEQAELLEELRAQGFTRVRIDGRVHELDTAPRLARNAKHSIDVVVDRVKARPEAKQRLAESLETALRHADGKAVVQETDNRKEHLFSAKFACPLCDYAIPELEPRLFSVQQSDGRLPALRRPGQYRIPSIRSASSRIQPVARRRAIRGWDRRNHFYYTMLQSLARHYEFDVEAPWEVLDERIQNLVLYGSGKEAIAFHYPGEKGRTAVKSHPFEGVVPKPRAALQGNRIAGVREELAKLVNQARLPGLRGTRLRREARHVKVADRTIFENLSLFPAPLPRSSSLTETRRREGAGRRPHRARDRQRLEFLVNVGLDYLALGPRGDLALRRRVAAHPPRQPDRSGLTGVMYVLDEPSIGLHQRDNARLIETLQRLRDLGQLGDRRRARRGSDPRRRPRRRHGPGAGDGRRQDRRRGFSRADHLECAIADRPLSRARADDPGAGAARPSQAEDPSQGRDRQQT